MFIKNRHEDAEEKLPRLCDSVAQTIGFTEGVGVRFNDGTDTGRPSSS
jgi:hypothetical protein